MRDYLLIYVNNTMTVLSVTCSFVLVKFHDQIYVVEFLGLTAVAICSTICLLLTYIKLGDINEKSKKLVTAWKKDPKSGLSPLERKIANKSIKSLQLLKIMLGSFGYYRKPASLRIVGKLVYYTTKSLMMTKNIS